jgi:hypothetical protein
MIRLHLGPGHSPRRTASARCEAYGVPHAALTVICLALFLIAISSV